MRYPWLAHVLCIIHVCTCTCIYVYTLHTYMYIHVHNTCMHEKHVHSTLTKKFVTKRLPKQLQHNTMQLTQDSHFERESDLPQARLQYS